MTSSLHLWCPQYTEQNCKCFSRIFAPLFMRLLCSKTSLHISGVTLGHSLPDMVSRANNIPLRSLAGQWHSSRSHGNQAAGRRGWLLAVAQTLTGQCHFFTNTLPSTCCFCCSIYYCGFVLNQNQKSVHNFINFRKTIMLVIIRVPPGN